MPLILDGIVGEADSPRRISHGTNLLDDFACGQSTKKSECEGEISHFSIFFKT
jgi:hypothetical protein